MLEFDFRTKRILRVQDSEGRWWKLNGDCNRCGVCCKELKKRCRELFFETVDGKPKAKCRIQRKKPFYCTLWPRDPMEELPITCGFSWSLDNG